MFEVHIFLLNEGSSFLTLRFENDVNMYGTQTSSGISSLIPSFENDVNMYGTQTNQPSYCLRILFENDVNMYGTQTPTLLKNPSECLRMM